MALEESMVSEIDRLTKDIGIDAKLRKKDLDDAFNRGAAEANAYWVERIRTALSLLNVT